MILFYENWKRRGNYLKNHLDLRQNRLHRVYDGSGEGISGRVKFLPLALVISFKGTHFPKDVILYAVFFYVRYGVSYRDLEEIMEER
jgi:hypothetical protein